MINRNNIRQAVIGAMVAGSLLIAGSAVRRVTIHDPGLWYFAGQLRLAMGDVQGGLRLVSRAAAEQDALSAKKRAENQPQATESASYRPSHRTEPVPEKVAGIYVKVAGAAPSPATISSPDRLRLLHYEFPRQIVTPMAAMEAQRRAELFQRTDYREQIRATLLRVREELQREGRALPETLVPATELPVVPGVGDGPSLP